MQAHKRLKWDIYELRCEFNGDVTIGSDGVGAGYVARIQSEYTPNANDLNLGILLANQSTKAGTGPINTTSTKYILKVPDVISPDPSPVTVAAFRAHTISRLEIDNLTLYNLGDRWRLKGDEIRWYVEAALQATYGAFTLDSVAGMRTPAAIPLLGIPPQFTPAALYGVSVPF